MGNLAKALAAALLAAAALTPAASPTLPLFSTQAPGVVLRGWSALRPAPGAPNTHYQLERVEGTVVLRADARAAMSGLIHRFPQPLTGRRHLSWRWRIAAVPRRADLNTRDGDDYVARVYAIFDYPRARLPFLVRTRLALAEALYGEPLPTAALNYVWDNRAPIGTIQPNAYTERARLMVLQSGDALAGQWVTETRDLSADFRAAFGEEAPPLLGVAIATDSDNTGETLTAWYGDFRLE